MGPGRLFRAFLTMKANEARTGQPVIFKGEPAIITGMGLNEVYIKLVSQPAEYSKRVSYDQIEKNGE